MELPLELVTTAGELIVGPTDDHSATRLLVFTVDRWSRGAHRQELTVTDVQALAVELLGWLVVNGHELPELPATDEDLEDEDVTAPRTDEARTFTSRHG